MTDQEEVLLLQTLQAGHGAHQALLAACQRQQAQIDGQQAQIDGLRSRVMRLECGAPLPWWRRLVGLMGRWSR